MSHDFILTTLTVAATILCYQIAVSPLVRLCSCALSSSSTATRSNYGEYPSTPARRRSYALVIILNILVVAALGLSGRATETPLEYTPLAALIVLMWRYALNDYDIVTDIKWQKADRALCVAVGLLALYYHPFILLCTILLCGRLGAWTHHSKASIRIIKIYFSWVIVVDAAGLLSSQNLTKSNASALLITLTICFLSHYFVPFWSKIRLNGRQPLAWVAHNRTQYMMACAYKWGWAPFVSQERFGAFVAGIRPAIPVLNGLTLTAEGLGALSLLNTTFLSIAALSAILFNLMVAVFTGLFFWENISIGSALVASVALCDPQDITYAFGIQPVILGAILLILIVRGILWHPTKLAWWDTPLSSRITFSAITSSGKRVGIYNNLMRPYETEFGRSVCNPMTTEKFITFPLGGVIDESLRRVLYDLDGANVDGRLSSIKLAYGRQLYDEEFYVETCEYFRALFLKLNGDGTKSPLPTKLKWLKPPLGHLYCWGREPAYKQGQDTVVQVDIRFEEEYYSDDAHEWIPTIDIPVAHIDIS